VFPDLVTVGGSIKKRPQDEHVERSLEEPDALRRLLRHRRHSTLNLAAMVDARLSVVKQVKRLWRRYRQVGGKGLQHGNSSPKGAGVACALFPQRSA
jgi:hypothetical protein